MSQADLAEKTGLNPSAVSHFETGQRAPSFDNLRKLSDALGVTTDHLLGRDVDLGAGGPEVQKIFRHVERMSEPDRQTLEGIAKLLADKQAPK